MISFSSFRIARFLLLWGWGLGLLSGVVWGQRAGWPNSVRPAVTAGNGAPANSSALAPNAGTAAGGAAALAPAAGADLYFTDFESFPIGNNQLAGRDGWVATDTTSGVTGIIDFSPTSPRAAFIGFAPTSSSSVFAWRPIDHDPVGNGTPVIQFNVDLLIADSTNGQRDDFVFFIYNTQGQVLGGIDFFNADQNVYRYDGAALHRLGTFTRNARYSLVATINFATNRWSVTVNGSVVFTNQPLNVNGRALTLGDIDAAWFIATPGSPGNNFMVFDNYRIATVATDVAPTITTQPQAQSVGVGGNATFIMAASGVPTPTVQWQRQAAGTGAFADLTNTSVYAGVATPVLQVNAVTLAMSGDRFRCVATNTLGTVNTLEAVLNVNVAPTITSAGNAVFTVGTAGTFTFTATGFPAPTFSVIAGSLPAWLTLQGTTGVLSGTPPNGLNAPFTFTIQANNGVGSPATQEFTLAVFTPSAAPTITAQPLNAAVLAGGNAFFSITATGSPAPTYQWQREARGTTGFVDLANGGIYAGATTATLNLTGVTLAMSGDRFRCVATNSADSITSTAATLLIAISASATKVAAVGFHSRILKADGTVWGMGANDAGQVGTGTTSNRVMVPVQTATNGAWIAEGEYHGLLGKTDGSLWAMGANGYGQLGDGTVINRPTPVQIATGVTSGGGGWAHSMFVKSDGSLWAVGNNDYGQLGIGNLGAQLLPVQVTTDVIGVGTGESHTMFVKSNGTLWGMGVNDWGQLGNGTANTIRQKVPAQVTNGGVATVAAGYGHTLFLKTDGTLWGMGHNPHGQLGDGSTTHRSLPVPIASGVTAFSAGGMHSLFVKSDGTLWATGQNAYGQLGDGTTTQRTSPVQIATGVVAVAGGYYHSLFVKLDGSVWAMGQNMFGQLGDGTTAQRNAPVQIIAGDPAVIPVFTLQPSHVTAAGAGNVSFTVAATGTPAPTYQWQRQPNGTIGFVTLANTTVYGGVASATLTITGTTTAMHGDQFRCVASNGVGSTASNAATLSLNVAPAFSSANNALFIVGQAGSFTVTTTGFPAPTIGVTSGTFPPWANLNGATGVISGTPPNITGAPFTFTFTASNGTAPSATQDFTLRVQHPVAPSIATPPLSRTAHAGTAVALTVVASGTAPLSYQWFKDDEIIAGATSSTLTFSSVQPSDAAAYKVIVTNLAGSVPSAAVTLGVISPGTHAKHVVQAGGYSPGGTVTITNTLAYGGSATGLAWHVLLPAGWSYASGTATGATLTPSATQTDVLDWSWTAMPASPVTFAYTLNVPTGTTGPRAMAALVTLRQGSGLAQIMAQPDPLMVINAVERHSADSNPADGTLDLFELTRVIELYNTRHGTVRTGAYRVDAAGEDGFTADASRAGGVAAPLSRYHSADTRGAATGSPRDGALDLFELTRVIELYNTRVGTVRTGRYHAQADTEDGFAPGP